MLYVFRPSTIKGFVYDLSGCSPYNFYFIKLVNGSTGTCARNHLLHDETGIKDVVKMVIHFPINNITKLDSYDFPQIKIQNHLVYRGTFVLLTQAIVSSTNDLQFTGTCTYYNRYFREAVNRSSHFQTCSFPCHRKTCTSNFIS
jgi:hypothetical protein